jgi:hypothetical protein
MVSGRDRPVQSGRLCRMFPEERPRGDGRTPMGEIGPAMAICSRNKSPQKEIVAWDERG